jgi:hypothetical protein
MLTEKEVPVLATFLSTLHSDASSFYLALLGRGTEQGMSPCFAFDKCALLFWLIAMMGDASTSDSKYNNL